MREIQTLGEIPENIVLRRSPPFFTREEDVLPLFAIDAAMFFTGANQEVKKLLIRSGRPTIDFTVEAFIPELMYSEYVPRLLQQARTNYQPIDCNFYDNFEAAIVQRRSVELVYLDTDGKPVPLDTLLRDLKTDRTEEFVQIASGEWLRLDRIVSVDGVAAGESCSF